MRAFEDFPSNLIKHEIMEMKARIEKSDMRIQALESMIHKRKDIFALLNKRDELKSEILFKTKKLEEIIRQRSSIEAETTTLQHIIEEGKREIIQIETELKIVAVRVATLEKNIAEGKNHDSLSLKMIQDLQTLEQSLYQLRIDTTNLEQERTFKDSSMRVLVSRVDSYMEHVVSLYEAENDHRSYLAARNQMLSSYDVTIKEKCEQFSETKACLERHEFEDGELSSLINNKVAELVQNLETERSEYDNYHRASVELTNSMSVIASGRIEIVEIIAALICLRWADDPASQPSDSVDQIETKKIFSDNFRWSAWRNLPLEKLSLFLMEEVSQVVRSLFKDAQGHISPELAKILLPLKILVGSPPAILAVLLKWLDHQPVETLDDKQKLLGILNKSRRPDHSIRSNVYGTSPQIARLVAALARPSKGDIVYDPSFGNGVMLSAILDEIPVEDRSSLSLIGVENSQENYVIGLARLILKGGSEPKLHYDKSPWQDLSEDLIGEGFDLAVSNLRTTRENNNMRSSMISGQGLFSHGRSILQALSKLHAGGKLVIVTPESAMFRGGAVAEFRRALIRENTVEAVISLPEGANSLGAVLKDVILVIRRGGQTEKIRMVKAEAYFERTSRRGPYVIKPGAINELIKEVQHPSPLNNGWDVSVESLAELSWDLSVRRRDQSELLVKLESLEGCEVVPLGDFCEIIEQPIMLNQELSDTPKSGNSIRYVSNRDLRGGVITQSSQWISIDSFNSIQDSSKLQDGDILLPKVDAIGKASVVRKHAIGSIAARTLFVIRYSASDVESYMDPIFLAAYLESSQVRSWFRDHTVGGTRGHLTKRVLLTLPVPFPRIDYQQDMGSKFFQNGDDVVDYLSENFTLNVSDPVVRWLERSLDELFNRTINFHQPLKMDLFERLFESMSSITAPFENETDDSPKSSSEANLLNEWFDKFRNAIAMLIGLKDVPPGPSLLNILQNAVNGIRESLGELGQRTPIMEKAKYLSNMSIKMIKEAIDGLFVELKLDFRVHGNLLMARKKTEINVAIIHRGFLPLRHVIVRSSPDWGKTHLAFMAEGSTESMVLGGIAPETEGDFIIDVNWTAVTLDGEVIEGKTELPFTVTIDNLVPVGHSVDIGQNPYVTGTPLSPDRDDVFFGREDLLTNIKGQIEKSGNVIFLEGNRRAGKTSILNHLKGLGPVDGWLGVYCSLQAAQGANDTTGVPTVEVFREIARSIANELRVNEIDNPLPDGSVLSKGQKLGIAKACRRGIGEESPFKDFEDYLSQTLLTLKEAGLGLLLMMDEFDKLQQGIDNGVTSPQTPENIRYLIQTYQNFSAILTGTRRLKKLREEYWSVFFGMGTYFGVSSLSFGAAERLITEPVRDKLTYSPEAVKRAIYSTARQPYLLQLLCNRIFDLSRESDSRTVTLDLVKEAEQRLVKDDVHFTSLWDYVGSDRRRFILALCHRNSLSDTPYPFNFQFIFEQLLAHEIDVNEDSLESDLAELRESELIQLDERPNSSDYLMGIPLMGAWIDRQQDLSLLERKARTETEDQHE